MQRQNGYRQQVMTIKQMLVDDGNNRMKQYTWGDGTYSVTVGVEAEEWQSYRVADNVSEGEGKGRTVNYLVSILSEQSQSKRTISCIRRIPHGSLLVKCCYIADSDGSLRNAIISHWPNLS